MLLLLVPLHNLLQINEQDVLVAAKSFVDPAWIPNDWYLSQNIGYRLLYNILAGNIARILPLWAAAIAGRVLTVALFAPIYAVFLREFRLPPVWVLPFTVLSVELSGVVAGEWMVKSFDTKSFAYLCALGALILFSRGRLLAAATLSGLACSFHVLVGGYAAGALALAALLTGRLTLIPLRRLPAAIACFGAAAAPGVLTVIANFSQGPGVEVRRASELYVALRVPHHTLPSHWSSGPWIFLGLFCFVSLLLALRLSEPASRQRFMLVYALSTLLFAGIGLAVFLAGRVDLLKYYWFRYPDAMIPFFGYLSFFALLQRVRTRAPAFTGPGGPPLGATPLLLACAAVAFGTVACSLDAHGILRPANAAAPFYLRRLSPDLVDALVWVKEHTPRGAVVASDPLNEQVYLVSERAQFVSYQHSPQGEKEILEWAERLRLMIGGAPLPATSHELLDAIAARSAHLDEPMLELLSSKYRVDYYVGSSGLAFARYPVVYRNATFSVFALDPRR